MDIFANYSEYFFWIAIISTVVFVVSLLLTPYLAGLIPEDYFTDNDKNTNVANKNIFILIIKSILGIILLLAGVIMLFTPGQGIISIVLGLFLLEFPGKRRLELRIINNDVVFNALNWIRNKVGKSDLKR